MKKILSLLLAIFCISAFTISSANAMTFTDVNPEDWYYEDVKYAVENGLINGKSQLLFAPNSPLTNAEAVKLAACLNQLYIDGFVSLSNGIPWYMPYVDYCVDKEIIDGDYEWNRIITRGEFVIIFAKTLPEEAYGQINEIEYGEIPDVQEGAEYYEAAYKLYRAGILTGSEENHILRPEAMISRAEVAAIVTRMIDESRRVEFSFEKQESETPKEENTEDKTYVNVNVVVTPDNADDTQGNINITDGSTKDDTNSIEDDDVVYGEVKTDEDDDVVYGEVKTDEDEKIEVIVVSPVQEEVIVNGTVSLVPGNSYVNMVALSIKSQPESFKITEVPARATFTVEAMGGTGNYTYQWEILESLAGVRGWVALIEPDARAVRAGTAKWIGTKTKSLTVLVAKDNLAGFAKAQFRCVITDSAGNKVTSQAVGLTASSSKTIKQIQTTGRTIRDID